MMRHLPVSSSNIQNIGNSSMRSGPPPLPMMMPPMLIPSSNLQNNRFGQMSQSGPGESLRFTGAPRPTNNTRAPVSMRFNPLINYSSSDYSALNPPQMLGSPDPRTAADNRRRHMPTSLFESSSDEN